VISGTIVQSGLFGPIVHLSVWLLSPSVFARRRPALFSTLTYP